MRYPFQSTGRPIFTPKRVVVSCLHDTVAKSRTGVKSRPGATTGVNSRRGDSCRHDILWWYHVNKCRAIRGNRSELAAARKSPRCHVNTPLVLKKNVNTSYAPILRWTAPIPCEIQDFNNVRRSIFCCCCSSTMEFIALRDIGVAPQ